jgi:hypothetical protein
MAYLHYANLDLRRPDIALQRVFHGLRDIGDYLRRAISFLEKEAVRRVSCRVLRPEELKELEAGERALGVWVEIDDLEGDDHGERTLKAFLDEHTSRVYERVEKLNKQGTAIYFEYSDATRLDIKERDPKRQRLCLAREPKTSELLLGPNTYQLKKQLEALQALQDAPHRDHRPLLDLFQGHSFVSWPLLDEEPLEEEDWLLLRPQKVGEPLRPGTQAQREFVRKALGSPDWAILEGPPGSGKTTTICELILQELRRGSRILLCASTHVAVDNVIEKLMDKRQPFRNEVIPVRIGDRKNISDTVKPWQFDALRKTERQELLRWLKAQPSRTQAQQTLLEALQRPDDAIIDRIILDSANVVCGTTIGILQHPDIQDSTRGGQLGRTPIFDVLIVDEASKTTFQEFLVPALLASRWVLVGDPRQLSPYVEEEYMATNLDAAVPLPQVRGAVLDAFEVGRCLREPLHRESWNRGAVVVVPSDEVMREAYRLEAERRQVPLVDLDQTPRASAWELLLAGVVMGSEETLLRREEELPLDVAALRGGGPALDGLRRRIRLRLEGEEERTWGGEIGWRLTRTYEKRQLEASRVATGDEGNLLPGWVEELLPGEQTLALVPQLKTRKEQTRVEAVREVIQRVQRVALPSILESLQSGFGRHKSQRDGTALSDGLPRDVLEARHTLLEYQHRMHPDISRFARQHIYKNQALLDPADMAARRSWNSPPWPQRMQWVNVARQVNGTSNPHEEKAIERELRRFFDWARAHPHPEDRPWEVAVLTFYRAQERLLRAMLQKRLRQPSDFQRFTLGAKEHPQVIIDLCTADRYQGHEADLVLLSFARTKGIGFLDSPNRLNVALTRGRYQTLLIGNQNNFAHQTRAPLLQHLAQLVATYDLQE